MAIPYAERRFDSACRRSRVQRWRADAPPAEAELQEPVRGIEVPPIYAIVAVSMVGGRESFGIY